MPLIETSPLDGVNVLFKIFSMVDLPAPLPPIIPTRFPDEAEKLVERMACFPPLKKYSTFRTVKFICDSVLSSRKHLTISLKYIGLSFAPLITDPCVNT
jgi:hypothetical protein